MTFLTQGFTRGFFRNADVRPAELKITTFPDTRGPRTGCQPMFHCLMQMKETPPEALSFVPEALESLAEVGRRTAQARCTAINKRGVVIGTNLRFGQ